MANQGDDCYFYYYSTCAKGAMCPFRHCEAALGNETVCSLWMEGRCYRQVCQFRHMELNKNRNVISCYWESQPTGCLKPHCPFQHERPRNFHGQDPVLPPFPGLPDKVDMSLSSVQTTPSIPTHSILKFTGAGDGFHQGQGLEVMTPSPPISAPTIAPVIVKPADSEDDNEESSHDGSPVRRRLGPPLKPVRFNSLIRKETSASSVQAPDFVLKTLAEIRQQKATMQPGLPETSGSSSMSMPKPVTSTSLSKRFAQMSEYTEPESTPMPVTRRIIATSQADSQQMKMSDEDVMRANLLQRLGKSDEPEASRTQGQFSIASGDHQDLQGVERARIQNLDDIKRERQMQRLQQQQVPVSDEAWSEDHQGSRDIKNVMVRTLADIKHQKLMQRLGRQQPSSSNKANNENVRVKSLADIRHDTLMQHLERSQSPVSDEGAADDKSWKVQTEEVRTLADIRPQKLMQRVGRPHLLVTNECDDSDKSWNVVNVGRNTLAEIRRQKLMQRVAWPHSPDLVEDDDDEIENLKNMPVKTFVDIRRQKLMQRVGRRHSPVSVEDDVEDKSENLESVQVKTLAVIRRQKLMQRVGRPHSPLSAEVVDPDESRNLDNVRVNSSVDIQRQRLMQRLGRPHSPVTNESGGSDNDDNNDESGYVQVKTLADIKRDKLLQRLGNRPLKRKTEGGLVTLGGKAFKDEKRGKLFQRLGTKINEEEEVEKDSRDFDPDRIQVKSLKDIQRDKLWQRLGKSSEPAVEVSSVASRKEGRLKKFGECTEQKQKGDCIQVKLHTPNQATKYTSIEKEDTQPSNSSNMMGAASKVAVKSLASIRGENPSKPCEVKIKSLAEIRAEKAAGQKPRSLAMKSLAEIRVESVASAGKNGAGENDIPSKEAPFRLRRKRQERELYKPPSSSIQGLKTNVKARLGDKSEKQSSFEEDGSNIPKKDVRSPLQKESLASRLQRKTISFLPEPEERSGNKIAAKKSLLEIRREKRLGLKTQEESDATSEIVTKSSVDIKKEKRLHDTKSADRDRTILDPSKINVKSLASIRREKRLHREDDKSVNEEETAQSANVGVKGLSNIRKEKRLCGEEGVGTGNAGRTSELSGVLVKSLADIRREKRLRQVGGKEEELESQCGSDRVQQFKGRVERQQEKNIKSQRVVAEVKKSVDAEGKTKKLTDAERRERRAKIWQRELQPENPPPFASKIRSADKEKGSADSSLNTLRVKSLDQIRKEKLKTVAGLDNGGKGEKGARNGSRPDTSTSPVKLARTTPSSPTVPQSLPVRSRVKICGAQEQIRSFERHSASLLLADTTSPQHATNDRPSHQVDSSITQSTVTTHFSGQLPVVATASVGLPTSEDAATKSVVSSSINTEVMISSEELVRMPVPVHDIITSHNIITSSDDLRPPSATDVISQERPETSTGDVFTENSSVARTPRAERLLSISDDLDNMLMILGESETSDGRDENLGEDDDILLQLDQLINS